MMHTDADRQALSALALLARGLTGTEVEVRPLASAAGDADPAKLQRPVLTESRMLVPAAMLTGGTGRRTSRAALAHAVAHWRHSPLALPATGLKPMGIAVASAIEDARAEALLCHEFPGVRAWFADALAPRPVAGDLSFSALIARMDRLLMCPDCQDDNYWVNKASERFHHTLSVTGADDYDAFRSLASILANDLGQMRVPFDSQQYVVPSAYRDDNSVLWRFDESAQPPDADQALHTAGATSLAGTDAGAGVSSGDSYPMSRDLYRYPEWNRQLDRSRPDWCSVIEQRIALPEADHAAVRSGTRQPLRQPQCSQVDHAQRLRRQSDGDELDLDSVIEHRVRERLRLPSESRIFVRAGKRPPTASALVLLDLSESANDRPDASAPSLLEIEKQAALLIAGSAQHRGDRLAIHGFSSNTRAEVNYYRLLDFGMPLSQSARKRIDAWQGRYSTRLGAALRHAAALLDRESAPRRAILVVTDGAPSDIDAPDPHYLTEDARMAVLEARSRGTQACCLALDRQAQREVRRIFGARDYAVAATMGGLSGQLTRMYERLITA